ncbi:RCC1 domain-containing protein [Streptomyces sp. NPDC056222]|uniref:RCC1 domain-containing protein n=1 Tax=Streptomyces sp. NPDC056222 TaxID=3345749 RepID=UPI0035D710E6
MLRTRRRRPRSVPSAGLLVLLTTLAAFALPAPMAAAQAQRVESWGDNGVGQLGDGTDTDRHTPVTVSGLTAAGVTGLAAGRIHGLALLSNGTVKAWGHNFFGQLGDGTTTNHPTPGGVRELSGVTAVAAGCGHSLALLSDGTVRAWGDNALGQLGIGVTGGTSTTPVPVSGLSKVTAVATSCDHSLALLSDGTVRAWGGNSTGQLGNGTTTDSNVPVPVSGLGGVRDIAAGFNHSLARLANGTVRAWGGNSTGQLGNGTTADSNVPVPVSGLGGVRDVAAGGFFSLARLANGTVRAWGNNSNGELGNGSAVGESPVPVPVSGLGGVRDIAAGSSHSLARLANGTVRAWGGNSTGQLGNGTTDDSNVPVPVRTGIGYVRYIAAAVTPFTTSTSLAA